MEEQEFAQIAYSYDQNAAGAMHAGVSGTFHVTQWNVSAQDAEATFSCSMTNELQGTTVTLTNGSPELN